MIWPTFSPTFQPPNNQKSLAIIIFIVIAVLQISHTGHRIC
jgi:hypothetical protein